jgi:tetratricopeptide (TPR) repeat protein
MRRVIARASGYRAAATRIVALCLSIVSLSAVSHAADECRLERLTEAPMLLDDDYSPVISVVLNDRASKVLLDTGGFWSMIKPEAAAGLTPHSSPVEARLGLQGLPLTKYVKQPSIQIGPAKIPNVEFFVAPEGYLQRIDATLGAEWLSQFDVEIDPVKNTVSLFSHDHCEGQVVHWPHNDLAVVPFKAAKEDGGHIKLTLKLAGENVRVMIDTGASESVLSMRAARRLFDLKPDSPGMEAADEDKDARGRAHKLYRYQFSSLDMGGIAFKNPRIMIADMADDNEDLILGMHQLRGLHLYFAYKEKNLYVTSASGDIAASGGAPAGRSDPLARVNAANLRTDAFSKLGKGDRDGALKSIEDALRLDPNYSDGYLARADIRVTRGERDLALKDYARALEINPDNLDVYIDRSRAEWAGGEKSQAIADVGAALRRNPDFVRGYTVRADFEVLNKDWGNALADAGEVIRIEPMSGKGYSLRAQIHAASGDYAAAYEDQTAAVKLQPKSAMALNNKCWFGAILGKLDDALDDCDSALDIAPNDPAALDSRGFVRLKKGQWDRAIKDYTAALDARSGMASSLYGRGMAKQQKGDKPGADADIAAAEKIDKDIARHFGK